jgi:hypothetical protein
MPDSLRGHRTHCEHPHSGNCFGVVLFLEGPKMRDELSIMKNEKCNKWRFGEGEGKFGIPRRQNTEIGISGTRHVKMGHASWSASWR